MKRSFHGIAIKVARSKKIIMANDLLAKGLGLSEIASELNCRRFRQEDGRRFTWKSVVLLLSN